MARQHLLTQIYTEAYLLRARIILQLTTHRQKSWVIASYYLILQETFLERMRLLKRLGFLLKHLQQIRIYLLSYRLHISSGILLFVCYNMLVVIC